MSENNRAEAGMSAAAKTAKRESEAAATSTAGVAAGAQQAPDRLLLTPSLRVEDQAEDEGEEAGDFDLEAALAEAEADTEGSVKVAASEEDAEDFDRDHFAFSADQLADHIAEDIAAALAASQPASEAAEPARRQTPEAGRRRAPLFPRLGGEAAAKAPPAKPEPAPVASDLSAEPDADGADDAQSAHAAEEAVVTDIMSLLSAARSALDAVTQDKVTEAKDPLQRAQEELRRLSATVAPLASVPQAARRAAPVQPEVVQPEPGQPEAAQAVEAELEDHSAEADSYVAEEDYADDYGADGYEDFWDGNTALREDDESAAEVLSVAARAPARDGSLESRIAELEAAVAHRDDEWEPDGTEEGAEEDVLPWSGQFDPDEVLAEAAREAAAKRAAEDEADEVEAPFIEVTEETVFEAEIVQWDAEVEDDAEAEDDAWEDVIPEAAMAQGSAEALDSEDDWQDADDGLTRAIGDQAAAAAFAAAYSATVDAVEGGLDHAHAPVSREVAEAPDAAPLLSGAIDREELRELVSEIVRQELQGALGERITRNVRKLVRREIHRALISQDLI
ncbi:hypothetical protein [Maritimibacter alkaliphilus]|uniref:hypothetical protein n=1 Tax=Maritimibacter alkaliphilus TaxID=404236 RepID=UPI001C968AC0|nr:hypothetical protein [Maritimibacter alkaliphilus]MBY6088768.1 hypothetical protein [Maritimibacter alkaliphilus]